MKLWQKKTVLVLLGIVAYLIILDFGALVFINVNIARPFWGVIFPMIVISLACIVGGIFWANAYALKEAPTYDLELLQHAVINQFQADIDDEDYTAISELLEKLIEQGSYDLLYGYLSEAGQENLKEGLTVKCWED